jgi:hypothetical protein
MPANAFDLFMAQHPPIGELIARVNVALWERSALPLIVKERMRIDLAEAIGCSYCARFRTDIGGHSLVDDAVSLPEERKAEAASHYALACYAGTATDELSVEMQDIFSPAEFTDLVFSIGWFIGMQHVGRVMHWDDACPVAPIRALVESGEAA